MAAVINRITLKCQMDNARDQAKAERDLPIKKFPIIDYMNAWNKDKEDKRKQVNNMQSEICFLDLLLYLCTTISNKICAESNLNYRII